MIIFVLDKTIIYLDKQNTTDLNISLFKLIYNNTQILNNFFHINPHYQPYFLFTQHLSL